MLEAFHLHESYAYYLAPTCWLPRESSSSVAGSNSKLLLPVIQHRVAVIIYVHMVVVSWPRGHLVHLTHFSFMMLGERKTLLMPSDANPSMGQESLLPMKDSCRLNLCRCGGTCVAFQLTESEMSIRRQQGRREGLKCFFYHQQGQPEGNGLHFSFPLPVAGQGGRETLT